MQLYYVNGLMMTNLCGYGNHYECDSSICECPHHEETAPPIEPDEEAGEDETGIDTINANKYTFD